MAALLLRIVLAAHAVGAAAFWTLQPRGFAGLSRSFFEHQIIVPVFALASLLAAVAPDRWKQARFLTIGLAAGFWAGASLGTAFAASLSFMIFFTVIFLAASAAAALLFLQSRRSAVGFAA